MAEPLFPGYVFCRLDPEHRFGLLTIPGVMHLVGIGNTPTALADEEIQAIREALRADAPIKPWPFLETGERIKLGSGPLAGLEGLLVEAEQQQQIVFGVSVLKQSVAVRIDSDWLPLRTRSVTQAPF